MASAQLYPVQANPNLIPPYSLKLSDYATTTSEKLLLNLLMTDVNEANLQVRLRMSIEGDRVSVRSTDFVQGATPIRLIGGVPTRLSNLDLRPYFDLRNLQGITPRQYNTPLPDGLYRFCFEVFDFVTGRKLSQKRCIPAYLVLNDPPFLNLPQRGEQIGATDPQNLIFQWTPRHLNATGVQYEFQLRELWDGGIDPQAAFLASPDLYTTTTFATTLHYGPGETTLLEGKTYGWRVRALVGDGISETSVFRNNGYSEIFNFTYTGKCEVPKFILAKSEGTTTETISWQTGPKHLQYQVQYRKPGKKGAVWFEAETTETTKSLFFLEPATTYEFRVGGQCLPDGGYSFSAVNTFTTPSREEAAQYNCGIPPEILITDQDPLESLNPGDKFTAGDFPVKVVEASGGNGRFSGKGVIEVPYLALIKIAVVFDNISINTDGQMTNGTVETDYDADFATGDNPGTLSVADPLDGITGIVEELFKAREVKYVELKNLRSSLDRGEIDQREFETEKEKIRSDFKELDAQADSRIKDKVLESEYATDAQKEEMSGLGPTAFAETAKNLDQADIDAIKKTDAAMGERMREIAAEVDELAFVGEAYDIVSADPLFETTVSDIEKVIGFLKEKAAECEGEAWASLDGGGVVPHCIWRDAVPRSDQYYSGSDIPFVSGIVDGTYQELEGIVLLPKYLTEIGSGVRNLAYAYSTAYLICRPELTRITDERLEKLFERLEAEKDDNGIWARINRAKNDAEKWAVEKIAADCAAAQKLRTEVSHLADYISEIENIKKEYEKIRSKVIAYFDQVSGTDNRARYEHGKGFVFAASSAIPVAGQLSKSAKVKKILQGLQKYTNEEWVDFFKVIDKSLRNRTISIDDIIDDTKLFQFSKSIKYLPGPVLPKKISATFESSIYLNRKLSKNERYFKYHGLDNRTGKKYTWLTNKKYSSEKDLRKGLAIRDDWGVKIEQISEFNVPSGTWVSEGRAASQGAGYPGKDYQAVITNLPKSWILKTEKPFK